MRPGASLHFTNDGRISEICIIANNEREQLLAERALTELGLMKKECPRTRRGQTIRKALFPFPWNRDGGKTHEKR